MKQPVGLHDSHHGRAEAEVDRAVRTEAFGEALGQTSWVTAGSLEEATFRERGGRPASHPGGPSDRPASLLPQQGLIVR